MKPVLRASTIIGAASSKTLPRFIHADAERLEFPPRQTSTEPQPEPSPAQQVQNRSVFSHPEGVMPREYHGSRSHVHVRVLGCNVGH